MELNIDRPPRFAVLRNRPLMTLMLGHFTIDMYVGLIPMLYPLLIGRFNLDFKTVGLVTLAYSGTSSLVQPGFGWLADRYGTRFIGVSLMWSATMFALIGFAPSFPIVLLLAAAAGIGSGAYHPFGALNANAVIDEPQRNTAMSIYVTGGTLGVAVGPLLGAVLFTAFAMRGTAFMVVPGVVIAIWLLFEMRRSALKRPVVTSAGHVAHCPVPIVPLLAVIGVMMSRTWTVYALEAFIPAWYASLGYTESFYGPLATMLVLSSAVGTIGSGSLADRFGRRAVIIVTLILTIPALVLFAQYPGPLGFVTAALLGLSAASTGPLMLITAQQLMVGRAGVASGLVLGLGFVTGAIGIPITGALADRFGFTLAIQSQVLLVLGTIVLARLLPNEKEIRSA